MQDGAVKTMDDLKEELMTFLNNPSQKYKKYKFNQLRSKMCGEKGYRVDMLREALEELEIEGLIEVDKARGLFRSFPYDLGYAHGKISINKHDEGFIMGRNGKKYKIRTEDLNDALDGDIVVEISGGSPTQSTGRAAAISTAVIRFSLPSVRSFPIGNWLPVRITGLLKSSSMKLRAEAVKAIVSVPCRMTKPSYRS